MIEKLSNLKKTGAASILIAIFGSPIASYAISRMDSHDLGITKNKESIIRLQEQGFYSSRDIKEIKESLKRIEAHLFKKEP